MMINVTKQIKYLLAAAIASLLMSLFGFISLSWNNYLAQKVLIIICSVLLCILSGLYIYIIALSIDREPNYFLYDRISKRNIPLNALTWKIVNDKINAYITDKFGGYIFLWTTHVFSDLSNKSNGNVFSILIAYKMLCDVAIDEQGNCFDLFENANIDVIKSIGYFIEQNGDADMAKVIINYKVLNGNSDKLCKYLKNNAKYIQSRMVVYVRKNIEKFY